MEWKEALPQLQENHTGVAISVTPKGLAQSTVNSCSMTPAEFVKIGSLDNLTMAY
jgi:hypothetical protein